MEKELEFLVNLSSPQTSLLNRMNQQRSTIYVHSRKPQKAVNDRVYGVFQDETKTMMEMHQCTSKLHV